MSDTQLKHEAAMFWASIVARAWEDPNFKKRLLNDATAALTEMGYDSFRRVSCDGQKVKIEAKIAADFKPVEFNDDNNTMTIYLPETPEGFENLKFTGIFGPGCCC